MSQDSTSSLELMSQETHDVLQTLLGSDKSMEQAEFFAKYRINPYGIHIADDNSQENVQISIDKVFSFPNSQCKQEPLDFGDSPPDLINTSCSYALPLKGNDVPQDRTSTTPSTSVTSPRHCVIPPNTNFPGFYQFDVGFQEEKVQPVKSAPWTYSKQLDKLFVKMRSLVPIRFIFSSIPPLGSYIKCVVVYKQPEHFREVVERCANHMTKHNDGHCAPKQLLRCENPFTKYESCPLSGRHALSIPVRAFDVGLNYFEEMLQFMCFNSCPGGLNRRPINVIFSFESNGQVLGRKVIESRICACPGRDRGNEEISESKKLKASNATANVDSTNASTNATENASTNANSNPSTNANSNANTNANSNPSTNANSNADTNATANVRRSRNATQPQPDQAISSCHETPPATPVDDSTNQVTNNFEDPLYKRPPLKRSGTKITEGFDLHSLSAQKRVKREVEEEFTIQVCGREKYELLLKIKEALDLMDMVPQTFLESYRAGCPPCGPNWFIQNQTTEKEEKVTMEDNARGLHLSNSQNSDSDGTPPSTFPLSQLSRTSSNTSSGGHNDAEYSTVRFSLKRTVSLERKEMIMKDKEMQRPVQEHSK